LYIFTSLLIITQLFLSGITQTYNLFNDENEKQKKNADGDAVNV